MRRANATGSTRCAVLPPPPQPIRSLLPVGRSATGATQSLRAVTRFVAGAERRLPAEPSVPRGSRRPRDDTGWGGLWHTAAHRVLLTVPGGVHARVSSRRGPRTDPRSPNVRPWDGGATHVGPPPDQPTPRRGPHRLRTASAAPVRRPVPRGSRGRRCTPTPRASPRPRAPAPCWSRGHVRARRPPGRLRPAPHACS